ncbi:hypothetical protein CYL18_02310 [Pradoshia eiseniae]|uniref:DUF4097 domain-containing protein n=1 Tax=Pradoshia eiseniae TaxID=2064768 RepID=A0A2S7N3Z7_9BACI|nr:DUF4097 family beta strand repeat-containing protein [Pradoshia eiseniae]PQD96746.1 hypothetical protein CYL18_02310 [Pradoshia eiseniae]
MSKHIFFVFSFFIMIIITGCSPVQENVIGHTESIEGVREIVIDFASTDVTFQPSDEGELEAYLTVYDDGPGVIADRSSRQLSISLGSDMTRLLNLEKKPALEVRIPRQFRGKVILDGASGNVSGHNLDHHQLDIRSSSGNVNLHFSELNNKVEIKTTSGNASVVFDEEQPNVNLAIDTNSGRQSINLSLDKQSQSKKGLHGSAGDAGNKMIIQTKSGNIQINE